MEYYTIPNWENFQHYKDRTPPWIKLHRSLLADYEFLCLQDASKLLLTLLWLFASQNDAKIPNNPEFLQRILHLEKLPDLQLLEEKGFLVPCKRNASKGKAKRSPRREEKRREDSKFDVFWESYPKKDNKKKSEIAFNRLSQENQQKAIDDAKVRYADTDRQFVPLATTYINGERWNDEVQMQKQKQEIDWQ